MRKARILLILGIWIAILPYLGFPSFWKNILLTLSGLSLVYFSYIIYKNSSVKESLKKSFDNFRENKDFDENSTEATTDNSREHVN